MNTILDAYYFAMTKVNELKEQGINVEINKYLSDDSSSSENIPFEKWCNVDFEKVTQEQSVKINEMANYLGMCGITFDMGGCVNSRDWSFDWSFSYEKGSENWEWKEALNEVEDMITTMLFPNES